MASSESSPGAAASLAAASSPPAALADAGVPPAWANGYEQPPFQQILQQPGGGQSQQQLSHLMQQQQHLAPLVGQQISSLIPANQQQGPTLNMMLQGMQQQAGLAAAGMLPPHSQMQQPAASPAAGAGQQPFVYMQQGNRDVNPSPNSTPGPVLAHPGQSQSPPGSNGQQALDMERNWAQQQFRMQQEKSLEGLKQQGLNDMFGGDQFSSPQERLVATQIAMAAAAAQQQQQQQELVQAARFNQYASMQGQFMQQQQPMLRPRPEPEGGQSEPVTPHTPHAVAAAQQQAVLAAHSAAVAAQAAAAAGGYVGDGQPGDGMAKSQDLVIDSWTNEDTEKASSKQFGMRPGEDKPVENRFNVSGWGGPPPANPSGWGGGGVGKPPPHLGGNWQSPPPNHFNQPPPNQFGGGRPPMGPPPHMQQRRPGPDFGGTFEVSEFVPGAAMGGERGRGRGRGGFRGGPSDRSMPRGGSVPGMRGRGRGVYSATGDHSQEKQDGKKSAIAETIAMMNKMKMEDKERKETQQKAVEERRKALGEDAEPLPPPTSDYTEEDNGYTPREDRRGFRGRGRGRGRGANIAPRMMREGMPGGPMGPGAGNGMGCIPGGPAIMYNAMLQQQGHQIPPGGMFMPPGGGGGIPPFPGIDGFLAPSGMPPFAFPPGGPQGGFYPPGGPAGNQFIPRGGGFPRGFPGGHRGGGFGPRGAIGGGYPRPGAPGGPIPMGMPRGGGRGGRGGYRAGDRPDFVGGGGSPNDDEIAAGDGEGVATEVENGGPQGEGAPEETPAPPPVLEQQPHLNGDEVQPENNNSETPATKEVAATAPAEEQTVS